MTRDEYIGAGYRMSTQVSQQEIDRAESLIVAAYVPEGLSESEPFRAALMALSYLYLLRHHSINTRVGGARPEVTSAQLTADNATLAEYARECDMLLSRAYTEVGREFDKHKITDIDGIYFLKDYGLQ